jgi:hypothetical protein
MAENRQHMGANDRINTWIEVGLALEDSRRNGVLGGRLGTIEKRLFRKVKQKLRQEWGFAKVWRIDNTLGREPAITFRKIQYTDRFGKTQGHGWLHPLRLSSL